MNPGAASSCLHAVNHFEIQAACVRFTFNTEQTSVGFNSSRISYSTPRNPEKVTMVKLGALTGCTWKQGPCVLDFDLRYRSGAKLRVQPVGSMQGLQQSDSFQPQP